MKRITAMILVLACCLGLCGCGQNGGIKDSASFYYQRSDLLSDSESGAISAEKRDITGHTEDLSYLISLYLMGPLDGSLQSPFPDSYRLEEVTLTDSELVIHLSGSGNDLRPSQFSLACGCLAMTCLELTQAESVTITCGNLSQTLTPGSLTLYDNVIGKEPTNGGTK